MRLPCVERPAVARAIGGRYAARSGVRAFVCAGSTARGEADVWSDLELLAAAVVRRHGQIDHFWRWRMCVERDEPLRLQAHFAEVAERIVHVACALSGVWWPGAKRPAGVAGRLAVAPPDLAARLRNVVGAPPPDAAASLESLVEERYALVAQHLPEVDVARLREIFRFARDPW